MCKISAKEKQADLQQAGGVTSEITKRITPEGKTWREVKPVEEALLFRLGVMSSKMTLISAKNYFIL